MKTLTFQISDEAYELLCKIGNGGAQYRDSEYERVEDFLNSDIFKNGIRTEEYFLNRNFGGTFYLIDELLKYGLVKSDGQSWHLTFILTSFGKEIIK